MPAATAKLHACGELAESASLVPPQTRVAMGIAIGTADRPNGRTEPAASTQHLLQLQDASTSSRRDEAHDLASPMSAHSPMAGMDPTAHSMRPFMSLFQ